MLLKIAFIVVLFSTLIVVSLPIYAQQENLPAIVPKHQITHEFVCNASEQNPIEVYTDRPTYQYNQNINISGCVYKTSPEQTWIVVRANPPSERDYDINATGGDSLYLDNNTGTFSYTILLVTTQNSTMYYLNIRYGDSHGDIFILHTDTEKAYQNNPNIQLSNQSVPPIQQSGQPIEDWSCRTFQNNTTDCVGTTPPIDGRFTPNQTNPNWTCTIENGVTHCRGTYPSLPVTMNATSSIPTSSMNQSSMKSIPTTIVTISLGAANTNGKCSPTNCFNPQNVTIRPGTQVEWQNNDRVGHTVTSGHPSDSQTGIIFDSSLLPAGKDFTFTFNNLGTYNYFCQVHPWLVGSVTVSTTASSQNSTSFQEPTVGPAWIKQIFHWYDEGKISEQDMISFVKWLIENKIIGR